MLCICKGEYNDKFTWNGRMNNGEAAAAGTYQVVIIAGRTSTPSGAFLSVKKQEFAGGTGSAADPVYSR